jgi:tetratricopeptide (TPR) repeat protein
LVRASPNEQLSTAIKHHQSGDFVRAEQLYRDLLLSQPTNADALHLLGVLARQCGRIAEAIDLIGRAIEQLPDHPVLHYNLAAALDARGESQRAIEHYRRAVTCAPGFAEAWQNLGAMLDRSGRREEARSCFERVRQLRPGSAEACCNLGCALLAMDRYGEACEQFRAAIAVAPEMARAYGQLAVCLKSMGLVDEAEAALRECLRLEPCNWAAWNNLGRLLHDGQRYELALAAYENALAIAPDAYEALVNLGTLHTDTENDRAAIAALRRAIDLNPRRPEAQHNLGKVYQEQGDLAAALCHFDAALSLDPGNAETRMNRALVLLQLGRFEPGWTEYEWRWRTKDAPPRPRLATPDWDGSPLVGKSIVVYGEQGVGDEIMFGSCYSELIATAGHVTIVCEPRLAPLFARSFPTAAVCAAARGREPWSSLVRPGTDFVIAAGSVPRFLRKTLADFPRHPRYLLADPRRTDRWRRRFADLGPGPKIGVSWRAGTTPKHRRRRSTNLRDWSTVLSLTGVHFVSLQYGDVRQEIATFNAGGAGLLHHWDDANPLSDLDDFAAQVAALDLVLSVGNATVHMAGALGTPCWALLPHGWGWRWFNGRDDSPWYASVRLLRQPTAGNWPELFQRVRAELEESCRPG